MWIVDLWTKGRLGAPGNWQCCTQCGLMQTIFENKNQKFTSQFSRRPHVVGISISFCTVWARKIEYTFAMLSPEKRKNPSDVEDEENEREIHGENQETFAQDVPKAGVKKRKRDLAWSFMESLAGPDPFEGMKFYRLISHDLKIVPKLTYVFD